MRRVLRVLVVSVGAVALVVSGTAVASATQGWSRGAYTCSGGDVATQTFATIPSGNYASITVTGACNIQTDAVINVAGDIHIAPGAALNAQNAPSTIRVGRNVTAAAGSFLALGCQPSNAIGTMAGVPCKVEPDGHTTITVGRNVDADNANTVILRGLTVGGNVTLTGGGGTIPWSIKGSAIGRNLTISDVTADWLGVQFNTVGGNVTLTNITATDPGDAGRAVAVVENTVGRNLNCTGLAPAVSGGFIPGEVNHVGRHATGQCASLI